MPVMLQPIPAGFFGNAAGPNNVARTATSAPPAVTTQGGAAPLATTAIPQSVPAPNTAPPLLAPGATPAGTPGAAPAGTPGNAAGGSSTPAPLPIPSNLLASNGATYQQYQAWAQVNGQPILSPFDWAFAGVGGPASPTTNTPAGSVPNVAPGIDQPEFFRQVFGPALEAAFPGIGFTPQDLAQFPIGNDQNAFNAAAGIFANGPFNLPGPTDALGGFITNLLFNQVQHQQPRSNENQQILRDLVDRLGGSRANQLNEQNLANLTDLTSPGALDQLAQQRENVVRGSVAAQQNDSLNALRDAGLLGQGAVSRDAALQAGNLAGRNLQTGLLDVSQRNEQDLLNRLGLAQAGAQSGAQITNSLQRDPLLALAERLNQVDNPAVGPFVDLLGQFLNLGIGKALTPKRGFLDKAGPLLGDIIGGAAKIGAAAL